MPFIEVKAFEPRFEDAERNARLIEALTGAMAEVYGDGVRAETWVVLQGVTQDRWGFGGTVRG
jgi:4-oxalocrotonate tautomerase